MCQHVYGFADYRYEGGYLFGDHNNEYILQDIADSRDGLIFEWFSYCPLCGCSRNEMGVTLPETSNAN